MRQPLSSSPAATAPLSAPRHSLNQLGDEAAGSLTVRAAGATPTDDRLQLVAEALAAYPYTLDVVSGHVERARNFPALLGLEPQDVSESADWWQERVHPDDLAGPLAAGRVEFDNPSVRRLTAEYRVRHRDGAWRWMRDRAIIERDADGTAVRVFGITADVTEEHERADALMRATSTASGAAADLRALLDRMGDAYVAVDRAWRITHANAAAARINGTTPEALIGRDAWDVWQPALGTRFESELRAALADGRPRTFVADYPAAGAPGGRVWVEDRIYPAPDGLSVFFRDVTEEYAAREAERAARDEAESARAVASALVESLHDAFVAYDADYRFTYVNTTAAAMFAAHGADTSPLGRVLWDAHPELVGGPLETAMRRAMVERVPVHFDSHDPELRRWYAVRVYPAAGGGLTAVWADVTAERRAQQSAAFLADVSRVLAGSLDYTATLRAVAEAAVPQLGDWCAVDIVHEPAANRWPPVVERVAVVHQDSAMLALGEELTRRYPTDWTAADGMASVLRDREPFFVPEVTDAMVVAGAADAEHLQMLRQLRFSSILVVPLVARGLTLGALTLCMTESGRRYDEADHALARDVAERAALAVDNARLYREAEQARCDAEAARATAEQANATKAAFLATMSHELRTPLNAIGGYAELLSLGVHGPVTADQRHDLARIQQTQKHLLGLINEVLNFARLESGMVRYDLEDVSVADAFEALEALMAPQMRAKALTLILVPAPRSLRVKADAEKLRQILLNLLSNAVKFTPEGGVVRVAATTAEMTHGAGDTTDAEGTVTLSVQDTGIGIPPEQCAAIFEPFVQVGRSLNNPMEGTGLGLAISRDLARGMGGELTVESAPGAGSTFALVLGRGG